MKKAIVISVVNQLGFALSLIDTALKELERTFHVSTDSILMAVEVFRQESHKYLIQVSPEFREQERLLEVDSVLKDLRIKVKEKNNDYK